MAILLVNTGIILIDAGINVNVIDNYGKNALCKVNVAKLLIDL